MLKLFTNRAAVFAAAMAFALSACSPSGPSQSAFADEDSILRYVPADTPYLLATGRQLPDELLDELEPKVEQMLAAYQVLIRAAVQETAEDTSAPMSDEQLEWLTAVLDEIVSLVSVEGLREAGFERSSRMAFFGHGLLPVLRIEVSDTQKFEDMITRVEEAAGESMTAGEIDGESYRYIGSDAGSFIVGAFDGSAVFTFLPAMMGDDELRQLLGLTLPAQSIAATDTLTGIVEKYGYTDHYIGLVDVMQVASIFIDPPDGLNAPLLEALGYDNSGLSSVCRDEIRETAGAMPRIVAGYNSVGLDRISGSMVVEMRADIATGLAGIAAVVPGLGQDPGGLLAMGMSFDLGAFRSFLESRIDAFESDPYECELFADLQRQMEQGRAALNQPLPPVAYSFRGFNAIVDNVDDLDFTAGEPPAPDTVDATLLVAMQDAEAMLAMGAMFSPELASLNLESGGDPVLLDLPQLAQMSIVAYAAMVDDAMAVSMGDGAEDRVVEALNAQGAEPPPVFSVAFDAGTYYELIAQGMMAEEEEGLPLAAREAARDALLAVGDIYDRMAFDVRLTDNGVEIGTSVTLAR